MIHDGLAPHSLEPDISLDRYLTRLASNEAAPGGGAAAGVTGAQATSLMSMVCALSETSEHIQKISTIAEDARSRFLSLVNADITNFLSLMQ
ncbi:MAG: cyclodeaminase/cyclohydrolase family protein, partial [Pseudomonadales bacterium]|nr:cyclodeaminase/cyclohydrolase family protein [Pseudomonadales bacterium]